MCWMRRVWVCVEIKYPWPWTAGQFLFKGVTGRIIDIHIITFFSLCNSIPFNSKFIIEFRYSSMALIFSCPLTFLMAILFNLSEVYLYSCLCSPAPSPRGPGRRATITPSREPTASPPSLSLSLSLPSTSLKHFFFISPHISCEMTRGKQRGKNVRWRERPEMSALLYPQVWVWLDAYRQ